MIIPNLDRIEPTVASLLSIGKGTVPSQGGGEAVRPSTSIDRFLAELRVDRVAAPLASRIASTSAAVAERSQIATNLFDAAGRIKIDVAQVAMHLGKDWRDRLFRQIDSLLDPNEWDESDAPPTDASARTFIRLLLQLRPQKKPGIAIGNNGNLVATWVVSGNRLTIDCMSADNLRWVLTRILEGGIERAAGTTTLPRLLTVLAPYRPDIWWSGAE